MIEKIDSGVLAAHQWVIDKTQIDPAKAANLAFRLALVLVVVRAMILMSKETKEFADWFSIGLAPVGWWCTSVLYEYAKNGVFNHTWRVLFVAIAAIPHAPTAHSIATEVQSLTILAIVYLCACDKPKPPKRKHSLKETTV